MGEMRIEVAGSPGPEEVAAIVAAIEMTWPKPSSVVAPAQASTVWRFADRWWSNSPLPNDW